MLSLSHDDFEQLVARALDELPEEFARLLDNVVVVVEDEASAEELADVGIDDPLELLGLYQGVSLYERDVFYSQLPDRVAIYRRPLLHMCQSREELVAEVRDTVVHELGHHFGLSDEEMPY